MKTERSYLDYFKFVFGFCSVLMIAVIRKRVADVLRRIWQELRLVFYESEYLLI